MEDRSTIQRLMPLMREFGGLERKRVSEGVTPLEFQRCLDLKSQIGRGFAALGEGDRRSATLARAGGTATRLAVSYKNRATLLDSILENIQPAGFFLATPFAAEVGTHFLVRITLEEQAESGEFPCVVVTSLTQGAHTLSSKSMGMGLKIEKTNPSHSAHISKIFGGALDRKLGKTG